MISRPPIADWPALDRALWEKSLEPRRLFESDGAGARWSEVTRYNVACGYGRWLSWLAQQGIIDPNASSAARVTRERVSSYITDLRAQCAHSTVHCYLRELHNALRVMVPDTDWGWLAQLCRNLSAGVRPVRDKTVRLRPIDELADLGKRLMDEAESAAKRSRWRRAVLFRDGLIIALLAHRPVRMKNLAMMRLGRHVTKVDDRWQILFAADETKSRVPYEAVLPAALTPRIDRYIDTHRPILMRGKRLDGAENAPPRSPGLDAVWVSETGSQLSSAHLWRTIVNHTREAFGHSVSPHFFRDCAATSIAEDNPRYVGDASLVLGHADHRTTEKHYTHALSLEASRRYAENLAQLRRSLKRKRRS